MVFINAATVKNSILQYIAEQESHIKRMTSIAISKRFKEFFDTVIPAVRPMESLPGLELEHRCYRTSIAKESEPDEAKTQEYGEVVGTKVSASAASALKAF